MRDLSRRSRRSFRPLCGMATALTIAAATGSAMPVMAQANWTWTLYADANPVVLAQEVPDTPDLKTTLECNNGTGRVRLSLYDQPQWTAGPATVRSGRQNTMTEVEASRTLLRATLPVDHPVFIAFQASGQLELTRNDQTATITIAPAHLSKLRRFGATCTS